MGLPLAAYSGRPTFAWDGVTGAEAYRIQMDDDADFASPERDEAVTGTDYVPAAGLSGGVYYWRVQAVSGSQVGAWSQRWAFTVGAPSPVEQDLSAGGGAEPSMMAKDRWDPIYSTIEAVRIEMLGPIR